MRKTICALSLAGFVLAGRLNIGLQPRWVDENSNAYQLSCEGAQGAVKYYVDNLPQGVTFDGNSIVVSGYAALGNYTITIKAVDQFGQSAERQITLTIAQRQGVAGGASGAANGAANGGVAGGVAGGNGGVAGGVAGGVTGGATVPAGGATVPAGGAGGATGPLPGGATNPTRLSNLITTYSSTTEPVPKPDYGTTGRFPTGNFPTGADPTLPNYTPQQIANSQTQPTQGNRRPVTADDVALRAASDRHQNASRGITNLITIIDQARANRDKAQNDIAPYTQAYNDAVAGQRTAQNDIIAAETRVSQITTAISSLTATIDDLRNKINQAVAQNDALNREKNTIVETIKSNEGKKAALLDTLKGLDSEVAQRVKELSDKGAECQSLNDAVNNKAREIADRQRELDNANANRSALLIDINGKVATVDDLRNKLQQAERDLADAKIRLADLDAQKLQLPAKIITLKAELDDLQKRAQACADQVARIQALINGLKGDKYPGLTNQINDLDGKITASRTRASEIDAALAGAAGPLADLRAKLTQAQDDLFFVRSQKDSTDAALRAAYQAGNDANNRVAFAKQNLDAIVKRFQDESKVVSDATLNLERARAEQALARQGLEELIAHYTDALPYSIVPNGNGVGSGTPNGNNPSGSPLGPVRNNGNGAPGAFKVGSWTNYLSTAYGAGVSPAYLGSVNQLFPFNFLSGTSGNQSQGTDVVNNYPGLRGVNGSGVNGANGGRGGRGRCGAQNVARNVVTGVVVEVRADGFDVRDQDGRVHNVAIAPCTQLNANVANYKVVAGDKAVAKGWVDNNVVQAEAVTCVQ